MARRRRATRDRQLVFAFVSRRARLRRWFRRAIVGLTGLAIVGILAYAPGGREVTSRAIASMRRTAAAVAGAPSARGPIERDWADRRARGVASTRSHYQSIYGETKPPMRRLLTYAGLTPDEAVLRWGNFDKILLLPSTTFEVDDAGRSYRMKPGVRSVWLRNVALPHNLNGFFLVPDRPELREILNGTGAGIVPGSEQTTNSWGCRGPEPDPEAPIRGIILGDSNMQGLLVADDETPPEFLARDLEERLNRRVSVLNTGHLGYSTEQYARTLEAFGDRFQPDFVVVSFCVNDFGDVAEAMKGQGDWAETRYWLERIQQFCRTREILCMIAPVPYDSQVSAIRMQGGYPGRLGDLTGSSTMHYIFPIEDLVDEFSRMRLESARTGHSKSSNPLYNVHLGDHHFSPRGCQVWASAIGRRVAPLLELRAIEARRKR